MTARCTRMVLVDLSNHLPSFQTASLQHYTSYAESDLIPVMQHMAKNVVLVNKGITDHLVRTSWCRWGVYGASVGMQCSKADLAEPRWV